MKLSIERTSLLKAVSQAQSVVERRNTIPILANVLIEAEEDHVSYYNLNKTQPYCTYIIDPKIEKLKNYFNNYITTTNE